MIHRECGVLKTSYEADMGLYPLPIAKWTVAAVGVIFFLIIPVALHEYYLSIANLVWISIIGALGHEAPDVSAWGYALATGRSWLKTD